jgi:hypothetical protein
MSYEGYDMLLCEDGHYHQVDAFELIDRDEWKCPEKDCGKRLIWINSVDETNGVDEETGQCPGYVELEPLPDNNECKCIQCGHIHRTAPIRYKIPEDVGCRFVNGHWIRQEKEGS